MANLTYKSVTKSLYKAVIIQVVGGILAALFDIYSAFADIASSVTGDITALVSGGIIGLLGIICDIVVFIATIWFLISLGKWKKVVDADDVPGVKKLWLASLLSICGTAIAWIPLIGLVGDILALVALILQLIGYSALKSSLTLPEGACEGAKKLFNALIISIIASILLFIPAVSSIAGILGFIALGMQLDGWKRIANS